MSSARVAPVTGSAVYEIRAGDSLWSIAERMLGPGASPAAIARKVSQLWSMNAATIRTGDPDLIMPGQELRLR